MTALDLIPQTSLREICCFVELKELLDSRHISVKDGDKSYLGSKWLKSLLEEFPTKPQNTPVTISVELNYSLKEAAVMQNLLPIL